MSSSMRMTNCPAFRALAIAGAPMFHKEHVLRQLFLFNDSVQGVLPHFMDLP